MGILNVTPDSFSDGGDYPSLEVALEHIRAMVLDGAEIIDIGGESTRPPGSAYGSGASAVSVQQEFERVIPIIEAIRRTDPTTLISIDTQKSEIASAAIATGADIINDVSAGSTDDRMFGVAAKLGVPIILMHGHGSFFKKARIEDYAYGDVAGEVCSYLTKRIEVARKSGIETVLADPGIGFAKTYEDNLRLLRDHDGLKSLQVPLVLGVSRKSTIGRAIGEKVPPKERVIGSVAAACYGYEHGAKIIRTHDVRETREALSVIQAIISV